MFELLGNVGWANTRSNRHHANKGKGFIYACSWSINYPWEESRFSRVAIDTIWYSLPPNEKEMVIPTYKHNGR